MFFPLKNKVVFQILIDVEFQNSLFVFQSNTIVLMEL